MVHLWVEKRLPGGGVPSKGPTLSEALNPPIPPETFPTESVRFPRQLVREPIPVSTNGSTSEWLFTAISAFPVPGL